MRKKIRTVEGERDGKGGKWRGEEKTVLNALYHKLSKIILRDNRITFCL